jgi:osmotically-inducible protein OsmY
MWVATLGAACGGADTAENVRKALQQANMPGVGVAMDNTAQTVHLRGSVGTQFDRTRAEEVASAVVGTSGRVLNELTVEGLEEASPGPVLGPDEDLKGTLDELVDEDAVLKQRDVNFQVADGVVTVTGEVRSAGERDRVTSIVQLAPEVKRVDNKLSIQPQP